MGDMLRFPLIHPPLLAALGAAGHGARVLLADANYSHSTNIGPRATLIHLNLRPGLVTVDQVLEPVLASVPIEAVTVMRPDDGSTPTVSGAVPGAGEGGPGAGASWAAGFLCGLPGAGSGGLRGDWG
jgi:RbsD / FucU transport protein family